MTEADVLTYLREALSTASALAAPLLLSALFTGLAIGLFQALTSIQEMTLTFVPKLGVILVVFWATAGALAQIIVGFFEQFVLTAIAN